MAQSYVNDCHDMREAQVLQNSDERLSYTYMGGCHVTPPPMYVYDRRSSEFCKS